MLFSHLREVAPLLLQSEAAPSSGPLAWQSEASPSTGPLLPVGMRSTPNGHRCADDGCPARQKSLDHDSKKAAGHTETSRQQGAPEVPRTWRERQRFGAYDVCEVFSPARLTAQARRSGLRRGWALDVSQACPVTGRKWNCLSEEDRAWCRKMVLRDRPQLLLVSPPCTCCFHSCKT